MTGKLGDGTNDIQFNFWDWGIEHTGVFVKGVVVEVTAKVDEYLGAKQLNVSRLAISDAPVTEFIPKGGFDLESYIDKAKTLIASINNLELQAIVRVCFNHNSKLWAEIPSAKGVHHAFVAGNLKHSVDVALKSAALAELVPGANLDLCIAGGLLQDLGKLWTYKFDGAVIDMTEEGQLLEHITMGIAKLEALRTSENTHILTILQHIVSSHHGKLEYGSPTTPQCLEAWIVHHADSLDAKTQTLLEAASKAKPGDKVTERVYTLDNRTQLLPSYIAEIMS